MHPAGTRARVPCGPDSNCEGCGHVRWGPKHVGGPGVGDAGGQHRGPPCRFSLVQPERGQGEAATRPPGAFVGTGLVVRSESGIPMFLAPNTNKSLKVSTKQPRNSPHWT